MYLVFRCSCGRHLYAPAGSKTRTCPCGKRNQLNKVLILGKANDAQEAAEMVRGLQLGNIGMTGFRSAVTFR